MENWHRNLETIANGKGSPQARYEDELCRTEGWELDADGYLDYLATKGIKMTCVICFEELDEYAQYRVCSRCREKEEAEADQENYRSQNEPRKN